MGVGLGISISLLLSLQSTYSAKKSTAEVDQVQGIYVFIESKPVLEYEYLGNVKNTFAKSITDSRDKLVKKAKETFPNADGIIIRYKDGGTDQADVIKFK